jgi:excisionase family DNA binding protein
MTAAPPDPVRVLYSVEEAAARLAIGRTLMFRLIRDHAIDSVRVGRLRLIPADAINAYVNRLAAVQSHVQRSR